MTASSLLTLFFLAALAAALWMWRVERGKVARLFSESFLKQQTIDKQEAGLQANAARIAEQEKDIQHLREAVDRMKPDAELGAKNRAALEKAKATRIANAKAKSKQQTKSGAGVAAKKKGR